ncbi:MAG: carboxypeptidase regulatory-like domain-containing protein [Candidatus Brocadiia bacterium]
MTKTLLGKLLVSTLLFSVVFLGYGGLCGTTSSSDNNTGSSVVVTGTVNGVIRTVSGTGMANVTINFYNQNNVLVGTFITDINGAYTANLPAGTYTIRVLATGYINDIISGLTVQNNINTTVEPVEQVPTPTFVTGTVTGIITDAYTGLGLSGATLLFRYGIGANTGTVSGTATTASDGTYSASLTAGNYTVEAFLNSYTALFFTATCLGDGQTNTNQNSSMTPVLSSGQTRIVLTWGEQPLDLDSHTTGPVSATANSTYKFFVHDYSNGSLTTSSAMAASSAQVKVYRGNLLVATYNVPNQAGTLWTVFEMTEDTITPINTMTYASVSYDIGGVSSNYDMFHVYFSAIGNLTASPYTELDVDDTSSYGPETTTILPSGSAIIVGTATGVVKSAATGLAMSGVTVEFWTLANTLAGTYTTDTNGTYTASMATGTYNVNIIYSGYNTGAISNVTVTGDITTTLETVSLTLINTTPGTVTGVIKDAFTGIGIGNVSLSFRSGINAATGTVVMTATTTSGGAYTAANLPAGNYTVEASLTDYATMFFTAVCIGNATNPDQNATITPVLPAGQTRIVLTWGATPSDLDSHMTVPVTTDITTRPHVYYNSKGSSSAEPYVNLDIDDMVSYGPETITIYVQRSGVYRYSIHDYSNKSSNTSSALGASGAQVKVYRGSGLIATYNVPNLAGTLWTVFELSDSTITPVNSMTYESDPVNVKRLGMPNTGNDVELIRNLPAK